MCFGVPWNLINQPVQLRFTPEFFLDVWNQAVLQELTEPFLLLLPSWTVGKAPTISGLELLDGWPTWNPFWGWLCCVGLIRFNRCYLYLETHLFWKITLFQECVGHLQFGCPIISSWWQLKYFLEFSPRKLGKMNPIWRAYVSTGLVQPPTSKKLRVVFIAEKLGVRLHDLKWRFKIASNMRI